MARVLKNKLLSRARCHAMRQSDIYVTEVYSDVGTNRVQVCYINHTFNLTVTTKTKKTKLRGLSPHANYTDRAAAAGRRS